MTGEKKISSISTPSLFFQLINDPTPFGFYRRHLAQTSAISFSHTQKKEKKKRKNKNLLGKQTSGVPSPYPVCSAAPDAAADSPAVEEASPVDPLSLPVKVNPSQVVNNQ
jgi:hypothetical protein